MTFETKLFAGGDKRFAALKLADAAVANMAWTFGKSMYGKNSLFPHMGTRTRGGCDHHGKHYHGAPFFQ